MKKLQYIVEYFFLRVFVFIVNLFPWSANRFLAKLFLPLLYIIGNYKKITEKNIKNAKIDVPKEGKAFKKFVKEVFIQNLLTYIEMIHLIKMGKEDVLKHITLKNEDMLKEIYEKYGNVIFVLGHLGNWELLGQAVAYKGYKLAVIARRQNNPYSDNLLNKMRRKAGERVIFRDRTVVREVLRSLKEGYGVAILNDQDGGIAGITTEFMGRKCSTPHGPVVFALKTGAPLVFVTVRRLENGDSEAVIGEPFVVRRKSKNIDDDIKETLQHLVDLLEEEIKKVPEQWNWLANRWRTER